MVKNPRISSLCGLVNRVTGSLGYNAPPSLETKLALANSHVTESVKILGITPNIDLFPSRLNFQLKPYVSYKPDPEAVAIDAFKLNWGKHCFYAFPLFSLIARVLNKMQTDKATGVVIVPFWPAQTFYPIHMKVLIDKPVLLSARQTLLQLPGNPSMLHPLHEKLRLLVCKVSGTPTKAEDYLIQQPTYLCHRGNQKPKRHMSNILQSGRGSLANNKLILFHHL
ncbi:reverse transcriptase [Plakobranchus ocellatus]|uniref:Reverse transcriptase n=1 Tax=Plakobranchus ocellatus TaxID=259542 RepID=A0AAV4CF14_9GAST|nr:reverse transcriptase [Plakobranchus ocellatus]